MPQTTIHNVVKALHQAAHELIEKDHAPHVGLTDVVREAMGIVGIPISLDWAEHHVQTGNLFQVFERADGERRVEKGFTYSPKRFKQGPVTHG